MREQKNSTEEEFGSLLLHHYLTKFSFNVLDFWIWVCSACTVYDQLIHVGMVKFSSVKDKIWMLEIVVFRSVVGI